MCLHLQLLAGELGLVSTKVTKADKAEHVKRKRHTVPQTSTGEYRALCKDSVDWY